MHPQYETVALSHLLRQHQLAISVGPPITVGQLYSAKTLQLCATGDPVCFPGGLDRAAHSSYKNNGMADQAADFVARQLSVPAPVAAMQQAAGQVGTDQPAPAPGLGN